MTDRLEPPPSILHVGLVCESEARAALSYSNLLGLELSNTRTLPAALAQPLFGVDTDVTILNYLGTGAHFEVFIHKREPGRSSIPHVCLGVPDPGELGDRAQALGFQVDRIPRGQGWVTFIDDGDGNRFEIKQAPRSPQHLDG